jgi:hypothetical protein
MTDEAVTVPNKSYNINNLSTYKVTLTDMFHHGRDTMKMAPMIVLQQGNGVTIVTSAPELHPS